MSTAITTVTRKICRVTPTTPWLDHTTVLASFRSREITAHEVAMLYLGEPMDEQTFEAHLALGNMGAMLREGVLYRVFEQGDEMSALWRLWDDECTRHPVLALHVIWNCNHDADDPPVG